MRYDGGMAAQTNAHQEPMRSALRRGDVPRATRWASNHDWCYRGDNTKYRDKK